MLLLVSVLPVVVTRRIPLAVLAILTASSLAQAQGYDSVGIRAQGMAGAFVAVADDATATWWNPAGLATGPLFNAVVEHRSARGSNDQNALGISLAIPSLGISYYRLQISEIPPVSATTASSNLDRQDPETPSTRTPLHAVNHFGATVGQSIGDYLVVGSTVKVVRADQTKGDVDVGVMGTVGAVRLAIAVKRLIAPELTGGGQRLALDRQVRIGAAFVPPSYGEASVIAAVDADLTTAETPFGGERHVAAGVEFRPFPSVGLRGGVRGNTVGSARPSYSVGASAAVRSGLFVDAQVTGGDDPAVKSWGFALRVTF